MWELAARQHGVVSRGQLLELGFSRGSIEHRIKTRRLHPIARGVYAAGRPELSLRGRWMAAILSSGVGAVLSHGTAAALWRVGEEEPGLIEISQRAAARGRPGIRVHRRPEMRACERTERHGIPVTSLVRTLIDIARRSDDAGIERAVNAADRRGLIDPESLRKALAGYGGMPDVARLRNVIDLHTFRLTDSELERRFLLLVDSAGLSRPLTGRYLNGFKVDFYWPDLRLVVETDGLRYHRTPAQQARDRSRDQAHTAGGVTPLRFTHRQVRFEASYVREILLATVAGRI